MKRPFFLKPPAPCGRLGKLFIPHYGAFGTYLYGKRRPHTDLCLLVMVTLLSILGTCMIFSAGYAYASFRYDDPTYFIRKQIVWLLLGFAVMYGVCRMKISFFEEGAAVFYLLTIALLLLVLIVGFTGNGAQRWISIGPVTIQPSELSKLTLVLMLAKYFSVYNDKATEKRHAPTAFWYGTVYPLLFLVSVVLLVMLQKHLSCIIILGLIGLLVIIVSGIKTSYIAFFSALGGVGVTCLALFTDYTKERITVWQNPELYRLTGGWQTLQGLMAIGSGGLFGVGFGNSVLKYCYISEPANDMIFTVLCEETGFFGAVFVLLLFAVLCARGYKIALHAPTLFGRITAYGISTKMAIQVLLNVAVVTNTIPNTGISLPFFSYGGSSLIMLFAEMGILLSISREATIKK